MKLIWDHFGQVFLVTMVNLDARKRGVICKLDAHFTTRFCVQNGQNYQH